jgi:hypothetical protein
MSNTQERRSRSDRRIVPRGGRRPFDVAGSTPLVLVVGDGSDIVRQSEAILTELKFAVAPAATVSDALRIAEGIHPDIIVARAEHASDLRAASSVTVPIVEYGGETAPDSSLVSRVRDALRKRRS